MIKIIIADDHRMFRESLHKLLNGDNIAEVIAEASTGEELISLLDKYKPDIVLMDIAMPLMDGIEATRIAIEKQPELKVLALSSYNDDKYFYSMLNAGAKGFILKNAGINELKSAIDEVSKGGNWFSPSLIQKVVVGINTKPKKEINTKLTNRELDVLKLICQCLTNDQIADQLNITFDTVKWHRANILFKTSSVNSVGLVIYAIKNKLFDV